MDFQGVFSIYTNHPGGNLAHEHKSIKFNGVGERPPKKN